MGMTSQSQSVPPAGLVWNAGGWFGAQLGGSCWIAICAGLLGGHDATVATAVLAIFLAANVIGAAMWLARRRLPAYRAMQALMVVLGVAGVLAVLAIERSGLWSVVQGRGGTVSAGQMYLLIPAVTLALLALFRSLQRRAMAAGRADGDHSTG